MKTIAFIFTLIILTWNICYSQTDCDFVYTRTAVRETKWNQFRIDLQTQLREITQYKDKILLILDTSNTKDLIYNKFHNSKSTAFALTSKDSIVNKRKLRNYFIDNTDNHESKIIMTSAFAPDYFWYPEFVILNKSVLFYNVNADRKREFIIFDFDNSKTHNLQTNSFGKQIGYSDTSIFLFIDTKKAKINGQTFRKGTIVSVSEHGAFIQKNEILDPKELSNQIEQFYNGFSL